MDEFGETPSIYVWPADHKEGDAYPENFWERLSDALKAAGIEYEPC